MIVHLDEVKIGSLLFRLVAKQGLGSSRYYVTVRHDIATELTAIEFSGHNLEHSERKFDRIVEGARASAEGRA